MAEGNAVLDALREASREFWREAGMDLALGRPAAAVQPLSYGAACYGRAVALIGREAVGRVEHIHLVRCFHGLAELGERAFADEARRQGAAALASGQVSQAELERIKF